MTRAEFISLIVFAFVMVAILAFTVKATDEDGSNGNQAGHSDGCSR